MPQGVVVEFVHQFQKSSELAFRKAFARKPAQVMPGQIGEQAAFVFSVRHLKRDEALQVFGFHRRYTVAG